MSGCYGSARLTKWGFSCPLPTLPTHALYHFTTHPYEHQLAHETGTCLATRWEGATTAVMLYHLPGGVFAELRYDTAASGISNLPPFDSSEPLADYAHYITLPQGLDKLEDL